VSEGKTLVTNGYLIDVSGLPPDRADAWRSRAWLLARVEWGTRDRLLEIARAVAAEQSAASAWITFTHGADPLLLTLTEGEVTLAPRGDISGTLAERYALDASQRETAKKALLEFDKPGVELVRGVAAAAQRFDSALLQRGSLAGAPLDAFRIEGRQYLTPDDLARLQARAAATHSSVSAALVETYLQVRTGLLEGHVPPQEGERAGVFMSLPPWFRYELDGLAEQQDRALSWVIHRIVARGLP
jgi:hypothetical protein